MGRIESLTIASVLTFCSAASAPAQAVNPIRVGLIAPLTGGSADFGNSVRLGAELAVKEINEAGGYLGRPFELVIRNDKAIPDEGTARSPRTWCSRKRSTSRWATATPAWP